MMDENVQIALIGAGAMGEAIIDGLLRNHLAKSLQIVASDPVAARRDEICARYGVQVFTDNTIPVKDARVVILAVKPQQLSKVMQSLEGKILSEAVVLSIVAGATLNMMMKGLNHQCVVRAMPNTPARIGEGITVWTASSSVTNDQKELVQNILCSMGTDIFLDDENYLDMATALSGTGPAYAFLFMEAMIDAGVHLGFPRRIAEQLVIQTVKGSVDYFALRKEHPASLRNEVTSPGGTSAAALYFLEKAGFRTAISRAIWAAYERSQELGKGKESQDPEK
jgi:pyrroline-5-carboxylate reductase